MADTSFNFNPARFAGGVAKSFVSATTQVISQYMPFTSELLSDASDQIFNVKEFINDNRPDRRSKNDNNILKTLTNRAFNASKMIVSDLSYGDLSFEDSRNMIGNYLSKHTKSEFDFGFDDDFADDYDFDGDSDDNSAQLEDRGFTVDDFAEGIHASTTATVNAIEASYRNTAIANAKSNNILGDRLIANNLALSAQSMQAMDIINKNISGINANLANIVEYNNTTMNDFIQNTLTHFNKVEQFMDVMTKRFAKEEETPKKKESTKIFEGTRINFGNLFTKATYLADDQFASNSGAIPFAVRVLGSTLFGDKMPKWIENLNTSTDFGDMLKYFNPMAVLVEKLFPELGKLKRLDTIGKAFVGSIREKLSNRMPDNKIGEFFKKLLEDDDDAEMYRRYKNKEVPWTSSDSIILQSVLPTLVGETNNELHTINSQVSNIIKLLENSAKLNASMHESLGNFHSDSLKYFANNSKGDKRYFRDAAKSVKERTAASKKMFGRHRNQYRNIRSQNITDTEKYRNEHNLVFNSETGSLESAKSVYEESIDKQIRAQMSGSELITSQTNAMIYMDGILDNDEDLIRTYGVTQIKLNGFKKAMEDVQTAIFLRDNRVEVFSYDDGEGETIKIDVSEWIHKVCAPDGSLRPNAYYEMLMSIAEAFDIEFSGNRKNFDKIRIINAIREVNVIRKESIRKNQENYFANISVQNAEKQYLGSKFDKFAITSTKRIFDSGREISKSGFKVQTGDKMTEDLVKWGYLDTFAEAYGVSRSQAEEILQQKVSENDEYAVQLNEKLEKAVKEANKGLKNVQSLSESARILGNNVANFYVGGITQPLIHSIEEVASEYITGEDSLFSVIKDAVSNFSLAGFIEDIKEYKELRAENAQLKYGEDGQVQPYWRASPNQWGYIQHVVPDARGIGVIDRDEEDPKFRAFIEAVERDNEQNNRNWIIDYDTRQVYEEHEDERTGFKFRKSYPSPYKFEPPSSFATGAMRIDKDKLVQVHEGEMILDKALSESVRDEFSAVLRSGGFDKMSDEQRAKLIAEIEASNEAFKDKGEDVLNDIMNITRNYKLTGTRLSEESACLIPIDKDDTPTTVVMKTLSEMATNIRIMVDGIIGNASKEEAQEAHTGVTGGLETLFGSYDKENKSFKGGIFTNSANKFIDDMQYWAFKNIGGFSYRGTLRDADGKPVEGDKQYFKNGEDNPDTIGKRFIRMVTERVEIAMDQMGVSSEDKDRYLNSISNLMGGVKGAGKGWVAGLAASGILGISIAPALGLLGGFAFANDTTKDLIFGREATDKDGRKYRYGGVFSEFVNKFSELGDDIKTNFKTTISEIGHNLRDATTMFIDNLIHKDKPTMLGKITTGIKDAVYNVTAKTTEFAVDAANIGVRLALNAAKIPFDAVAGIIGGKAYRKAKRHEKWAAKDTEVKNIVKEFALYQRATGSAASNFLAGAAEWDLRATQNARANLAVMGGLLSHGYDNLNNKFMSAQDRAKAGGKNVLEKISEGLSTFHKETGIGIKALIQMIPTALFVAGGNIPAALATAGFNIGNIAMENLLGTGLVPLLAKGIQLLGTRIGSKFKRTKESAGNIMHTIKRRLGMRDGKFYLKRMNSSVGMDEANILSELEIDPDLQDKYYAWVKNGRDESQITADELEQFRMIDSSVRTGLTTKNQDELKQLKADEDLYKQLKKKKNLTPEEKEKLKELKLGKIDRRGRIGELNYKANMFHASHDINADNYRDLLERNAQNRDQYKAALQFKDTLFAGKLTKDMFIDGENISDDELAKRQKDYDNERTKLRKQILKKFGNTADWELHQDEIKEMIMNNEYVGKSAAALKDKSMDDIKKFVLGNAYTDETIKKGGELEQRFKDRITGDGDSIFSYVKQTKEDLKNMLELFKTWINSDKKTGDAATSLSVGSSRTAYAKMHGFDIKKLKNGDAGEKARFDKAVEDGELDVETINAITQAAAGHDTVTEEDYNQYASGATNIPHDQIAKLHAGEAVLDAETAKSFRSGAFGGGILADTMVSIKSGIGDLVKVFKGDEHGSEDAKKSFLDKMKESFDGVGKTISGAVFGSGLIPINPLTGKPDIPKIVARAVALIGGLIIGIPLIKKLGQTLAPVFKPIIDDIKETLNIDSIVGSLGTTISETISTVIADSISQLPATLDFLGDSIVDAFNTSNKFWENVGAKIYENTYKGKSDTAVNQGNTVLTNADSEVTAERNEKMRNYLSSTRVNADNQNVTYESNGAIFNKYTFSDADIKSFLSACESYFDELCKLNKKVYKKLSKDSYKQKTGGGTGDYDLYYSWVLFPYLLPCEKVFLRKFGEDLSAPEVKSYFASHVIAKVTGVKCVIANDVGTAFLLGEPDATISKARTGVAILNGRINIIKHPNATNDNDVLYTFNSYDTYSTQSTWKQREKFNHSARYKKYVSGTEQQIEQNDMDWNNYISTVEGSDDTYFGYTQNDPRWASMGYGKFRSGNTSTMGAGGCGPTAMSNVYTQLTGRNINPAQMARFSQANGYNTQGGTSAGLFTSGARKLGLSSNAIGKNGSAIGRSVRRGNNVVIAGRNGPYTRAGHIMSVRGVDSNGNAIVDDPLKRGSRRIPMNVLTKGMTHAWSIGYGDAPLNWSGHFSDGEVNFNPNGGSFGFDPNINAGCLLNSYINGYIAAALRGSDLTFNDLYKAGISPSKMKSANIGIGSTGYVSSYEALIGKMNQLTNRNIHAVEMKGQTAQLLSNIESGIPVVLHTNGFGNNTALGKIINANEDKVLTQHAVMIPGTYSKDGKKYAVIIQPGRSTDQINKTSFTLDDVKTALNGSNINHAITYTGFSGGSATKSADLEDKFNNLRKASLDKNNQYSNKYREEFISTFGFEPEKYNSYQDYIRSTSLTQSNTATASTASSAINTQIPSGDHDHSNFADYFADLISTLAGVGSNLIGAFLTGDASLVTKGLNSGSSGTSSYSGSSSVSNGGSGSYASPEIVVNKTYTQVMLYVTDAYNNKSDEINKELAKQYPKYTVSDTLYNKWKYDASDSINIAKELASREMYWENALGSYPSIFTWVLVMTMKDYPKNISREIRNSRISADIISIHKKLSKMAFIGSPHNDYDLLPQWAKSSTPDGRPSSEIPGGIGGGAALSRAQIASVHQYLMDIITANETGASIHDPSQIDKAYFSPTWLSGEGNVTMGRIGFYANNAKKIFDRAANNPALSDAAKNTLLGVSSDIGGKRATANSILSVLNSNPELKPSIMAAEDAMANEFVWDYVSRALAQYNGRGMSDPRSIILGAEFAGVAPASVSSFYSAVTNPGASNELDQVRQGMFNTIAGFRNYGKYGNGWKNRINGMYDALTSSNGYNPHTGKYYPIPSDVAALIPGNGTSIGSGDAGYNMRDNNYRYTNDIYMGDADHPMNVTMDNTPVTTRLDKLIYLLDSAVNYTESPKSGTSNAKSLGNGNGDTKPAPKVPTITKGETSIGQHDKLSSIHSRIARRTRTNTNYNHM